MYHYDIIITVSRMSASVVITLMEECSPILFFISVSVVVIILIFCVLQVWFFFLITASLGVAWTAAQPSDYGHTRGKKRNVFFFLLFFCEKNV